MYRDENKLVQVNITQKINEDLVHSQMKGYEISNAVSKNSENELEP